MIKRTINHLILLSIAVLLCSDAIAKSWQIIQEESRNAVVYIAVVKKDFNWFNPYIIDSPKQGSGTGFFIDQNGSVITCAHVIKDAVSVFIIMPSLGKQFLKARVTGLCPDHDVALLHLEEESLAIVRKKFGTIPQLALGDSDFVKRGEEIIALGYPGTTIETHQLKGTTGVISARLNRLFQSDVASYPGNSGGPMIDRNGNVIGIASSGMTNAQNINFAIPINTAKHLLPNLYEHKLLRMQSLGIVWSYTTKQMRKYVNLSDDQEGCMVCDVLNDKIGFQIYDVISKVNGYVVDNYGEIRTLADGDAIRFEHYIHQLPLGETVIFDIYRNGQPMTISMIVDKGVEKSIPTKYPAFEKIDYEVFAGMVIMPLTANYIQQSTKNCPGLQRFLTNLYADEPRLVISDVIPDSQLAQNRIMHRGDTINEINGEKVCTLDDFRKALEKSIESGIVTIKTTDETGLLSDNILHVLSLSDSCKETVQLSQVYRYPVSETITKLIEKMG
jgi:S1-C subfamily serine protease